MEMFLHLTVCKQKVYLSKWLTECKQKTVLNWIVWIKVKLFYWVQKKSSVLFNNVVLKMCLEIIYLIYQ